MARQYWFCPLVYFNRMTQEELSHWEIVGYSEFNREGTPRIVELKRVET